MPPSGPPGSGGRVRLRYGRLAAASSAVATTLVSVLGGLGVIATGPSAAGTPVASGASAASGPERSTPAPLAREVADGTHLREPWRPADPSLPADSGEGRRVVFSESRQQVWLVDGDDEVVRTYLVSGSAYDNLDPGTYEVYSRSRHAVGIDDAGTMGYFVRFTVGDSAAIGFHDIPVHEGEPVQTLDELGTPLSHGCIRQRHEDAVALWDFAHEGTTVVVTP